MIRIRTLKTNVPTRYVSICMSVEYVAAAVYMSEPIPCDDDYVVAQSIALQVGALHGTRGKMDHDNFCDHVNATGEVSVGGLAEFDTSAWSTSNYSKIIPSAWRKNPSGKSSTGSTTATSGKPGTFILGNPGSIGYMVCENRGGDLFFSRTYDKYGSTLSATVPNGVSIVRDYVERKLINITRVTLPFTVRVYNNERFYGNKNVFLSVCTSPSTILVEDMTLDEHDINLISRQVNSKIFSIEHDLKQINWSAMANNCYFNTQYFSGNGMAYAKDIAEIKQLLPPVKAISNWRSPRSWGQVYLWLHYGVRLTEQDTRRLIKAIKGFIQDEDPSYLKLQTKYDTRFSGSTRANIKCSFEPRSYASRWIKSQMMDMNLTLKNFWDLIPFSFVIDWFADVSYYLNQYESISNRYAYYLCKGVTYSLKTTVPLSITVKGKTVNGLIGSLYNRWTGNLPAPNFANSWQPDLSNHWVEAAALVVANQNKW